MSNIANSLYNFKILDDYALKDTYIHKLHPIIKLLTTGIYLTMVVSFGKIEVSGLLPLFFYPVLIFTYAEIPIMPILKRLLLISPFIIGIGILNPVFDNQTINFGGFEFSRGWITFLSIIIKSCLTVSAALLLIATTGMDKLAVALRMIKVPRLFVLQLILTYRYISVLTEEVFRILTAYSLRAPEQKGIHRSAWGSLAGQLILRTFDRAERVYDAMRLRGFDGEYNTGENLKIKLKDFVYLAIWSLFFIVVKNYDIPSLIGVLFAGVLR